MAANKVGALLLLNDYCSFMISMYSGSKVLHNRVYIDFIQYFLKIFLRFI
jgi:hypothetical protein